MEDHKSAPIVLIIPGSGPTDRNGNSLMLQANSYRMLAENLAENGISSLRYDKLMIGKSESSIEEKDLRFETNVKQVTALIDYLSKKKFENIILLGHSEGSLIGVLAAQQRSISKFISLAGTGRAIDEVLIQQIKEQNPNFEKEVNNILETLKQGDKVDDFSPELASLFRKSVQPYLISWLKYNPKDEIRKLEIPILILHGSTDIQVTKKDALLQKEGNDEAELKIIKGMNQRN
ncbi:alpha/beta hydrolase [Brumimicrobium salinarum]|uniref:Alpha/beta hydrolase n=1 Tax=Brumimicrobium salinarum TaxID=2058658 RepID=A0A2I0R2A1_9FLAO|nr:alpha/beta hydrolase [Brumimicrobium salinarum]